MEAATGEESSKLGPKRRKRHYSYNEGVDEPAKLIADEPVAIEQEVPSEENEPVERTEENNKSDLPAFEE
jgi:hypothetical protein